MPGAFDWGLHREAESHLRQLVDWFGEKDERLLSMTDRLMDTTGTRLFDWVDHFHLPTAMVDDLAPRSHGFVFTRRPQELRAPGTSLAPIYIAGPKAELSLRVGDLEAFKEAWKIEDAIEGEPHAASRRMIVFETDDSQVTATERRGHTPIQPSERHDAGAYDDALRRFSERKRDGDEEEAFEVLEQAISASLANLSKPRVADAFFRAEIDYWLSKNPTARAQVEMQDSLGLGLANHDHLTFRSSRQHFRRLMRVMDMLGMEKRESFYAGETAGWGAQIFEDAESGYVVFADVDLYPEERTAPELVKKGDAKIGTVGLWVELHGESVLGAGLHHLALKVDFDRSRRIMGERAIEVMKPFSDFPFLRQAFTKSENWPVQEARLDSASDHGHLDQKAMERFAAEGAAGSVLELIERGQGFKGFNQDSVSAIIKATDPRRLEERGA